MPAEQEKVTGNGIRFEIRVASRDYPEGREYITYLERYPLSKELLRINSANGTHGPVVKTRNILLAAIGELLTVEVLEDLFTENYKRFPRNNKE